MIAEDAEHPMSNFIASDDEEMCDRGSIIPSERFYATYVPHRCAEIPDSSFIDTPDLVDDIEMEIDYSSYAKRKHRKQTVKHPYITYEYAGDMFGGEIPLAIPYEEAARSEHVVNKEFLRCYYGKYHSKAQWGLFLRKVDWRRLDDDLKPLECGEHHPLICRTERTPSIGPSGTRLYLRDRITGVFDYERNKIVYPYAYPLYDFIEYDIADNEVGRYSLPSCDIKERVTLRRYGNIRQFTGEEGNVRQFLHLDEKQ